MNPIDWATQRLRGIFARRTLERDMHQEMDAHLERSVERLMARGMSPAAARHAARREFGNVGVLQEQARDIRTGRWVHDLGEDVRFALRHFARHKVTAITVVAVLALGIGTNTTFVSFLQAWFSRPAPAMANDAAHALVYGLEQPSRGARWQRRGLTGPEIAALERTRAFAGVAGWVADEVVLDLGDGARAVAAHFVTPNFFRVAGVPHVAGAGLNQQASSRDQDLAVVMSHASATSFFGSPSGAIGRRILVNDVPVRIVGVAAPRFQGVVSSDVVPALWIPVSVRAEIARVSPRWLEEGGPLRVFARLAPSVSHEQATALVRPIIARSLPDSAIRVGMSRDAAVLSPQALPPGAQLTQLAPLAAVALMGMLILLVTCTNVSSLMVAAAVGRRNEIAVRLSLGASRSRLVRQLITESTLLALIGAGAGLALCWAFLGWVTRRTLLLPSVDLTPDLTTVAWTLVIAVGTGILFGLSPALHATRDGVAGALRDSGSGATHRSRLQRSLVIAQIALSQPLLVVLGVMLSVVMRSYDPLPDDIGRHVVSVEFRPLRTGAEGHRAEAVEKLISRLAAHDDVVGVVPEAAGFLVRTLSVPSPNRPEEVPPNVHLEGVTPGYFALLNVPVMLGRDVALADTAARDIPVVIGNDLAQAIWGDGSPIGQALPSPPRRGSARDSMRMTVVGVYDATRNNTRGSAVARVFTAHGKAWRRDVLLVRTRGSAEATLADLQHAIRDAAPGLPVTSIETLALRDAAVKRGALQVAGGAGGAGAIALLLASIGLYGVVSLSVRQRTREIGIRIAIGANPVRVARMFLVSGIRASVVAVLIGLPLSLAGVRVLMSLGVEQAPPMDLGLIGLGIAVILLVVASATAWLPARRAALVDPARTLRTE